MTTYGTIAVPESGKEFRYKRYRDKMHDVFQVEKDLDGKIPNAKDLREVRKLLEAADGYLDWQGSIK